MIRRYVKSDIPMMLDLLGKAIKLFHYRDITYSRDKTEAVLIGNLRNPNFFCHVVINDDIVVGALAGMISEFPHSYEAYAQDWVFYINPEHRSLTGAVALVKAYITWAKHRGAAQIRIDQSTGYKMEKFAMLMKRCGFSQIGTKWSMKG